MPTPTPNRSLYDRGRGYARRAARLNPALPRAAVVRVARSAGEGVKEVRLAFDFARHVDAVAAVVPAARALVLDGDNPHLTPRTVALLAGTTANTIRAAIARAAAGLHPFAPAPPPGLPPDRAVWHYDLARLREAGDLLERAAGAARVGPPLPAADRTEVAVHATAVGATLAALRPVLGGRPRRPSVSPPRATAAGVSDVVRWVARARELVADATGDLLRSAHARPVGPARHDLAAAARAVAVAVAAVREAVPVAVEPVAPPAVLRQPGGPLAAPGTYVVLLRAPAAGVVRIGRLGSFRLPAGYLLYVGSAFQAGGVAGRTRRHLAGTGPRLWGVDDLRGFVAPVGLWWTHHPARVEHAWARALAGMPAYSCPAPGAGATDCNRAQPRGQQVGEVQRCPAHLFHTPTPPSVAAFARQLGASGSGGYAIHHRNHTHGHE